MQQNSSILTPVQRRAFIWLAIALGVGILLWLLSPVLTPFLLGAILAYILQPGVAWMVRRRVPRGLAALLMMNSGHGIFRAECYRFLVGACSICVWRKPEPQPARRR